MKMLAIASAVLIAVSSSALVMAQQPPDGGNRPRQGQGQGGGNQDGQGGRRGNRDGGGGGNRWGQMRSPYANQYEVMTREITTLTDDQKAKLKTKIDEMNKELDELREDSQTRMRQLFQGGGDGDREAAMKKAQETMLKIGEDQQKLIAEHQSRVNAELTPEQREKWETYKLTRTVNDRLRPMNLTDEQKSKLTPLIAASVKEILALKDAKDPKATAAIQGALAKKIVADVLTTEQAGILIGAGNQMQPLVNMMGGGGMGGGGGGGGGMRRGGGDGLP